MHINLELLECVYLVSAMLLEIPYMAAHEFDARRRMISKQFHHQLRVGERQPLLGMPHVTQLFSEHLRSMEKEGVLTVVHVLPYRTPREHEGACGGRQQGHEDGRLEDLPLVHHQREDEQQSVGPVP